MLSEMMPKVEVGVPGVELNVGDHVCAFYPSMSERDEILIPYLAEGLHAGDKCIAVLDSGDGPSIARQVRDSPDDPTARRGDLAMYDSRETYLADGRFATDAMLEFWEESVTEALGGGFSFTRIAGEMTWALSELPGVEDLVEYEAELNRFLPRFPQVVVCLYELDRFDGEVLVDVLKTHPKVLLGGIVLANPYYLEPDEFLASRW